MLINKFRQLGMTNSVMAFLDIVTQAIKGTPKTADRRAPTKVQSAPRRNHRKAKNRRRMAKLSRRRNRRG